MAIDPARFNKVRKTLDDIMEWAPGNPENKEFIADKVFGPALRDVEKVVNESRPPRLYVVGRSGAGKSSLINALANKEVADVGAVESTTVESNLYHISFSERYASWDIVDSRGLFEAMSPDGDDPEDTVALVKEDLEQYQPDALLHVMTPDQVRAGKDDFEAIEYLRGELGGLFPPIVYCFNKVDMFMSPGDEWPPHENPSLAGDITSSLDYLSYVLDEQDKTPFQSRQALCGYEFDSEEHVGAVPLYLKDEPYWNVETLSWLIGDFLPADARLQFVQAQRRDELMRRMARDLTNRFAELAVGVGGAPTPVADIAVIAPLQMLLVLMIGSYSCREFGLSTAKEYLSAFGGTTVAGLAGREVARGLIEFVPGAGEIISAAVAGGGTYAIGRSAEAFFFEDEVIKPNIKMGIKKFRGSGNGS